MANDPLDELEKHGVPCHKFEEDVKAVIRNFSPGEVAAFATIWRKAADGGLNQTQNNAVGWIFGRVGY